MDPWCFLFGAIIIGLSLNIWQAAIVALAAVVGSYLVVGVLSIAGKVSGVPMRNLAKTLVTTTCNIPCNKIWAFLFMMKKGLPRF